MEILLGLGLAAIGRKLSEPTADVTIPSAMAAPVPFVPNASTNQNEPVPIAIPQQEPAEDGSYMFDRKLEMYTGGSSKLATKTAPPVLFTPTQQIFNSRGAYQEAVNRFQEIPNAPMIMNNVTPVEKTMVGPGIGLDYFQTARDTGFQEMFRILPGNVNGYRRNTEFEGKVIPGKALVENMQSRDFDYRSPLNADMDEQSYGPIGNSSSVHRENLRGTFVNGSQKKVPISYVGGAQGGSREQAQLAQDPWAMYTARTRDHNPVDYVGGASKAKDAAYGHSKYLVQPNQRTFDNPLPILGGSLASKALTQHDYDHTISTQRGQDQPVPTLAGKGTYMRTLDRDADSTDKTQRGNSSNSVVLGGKGTNTRHLHPEVQVYGTHRDTQTVEYSGIPGRVRSGTYAQGVNVELNENKPVVANMPHAGRMNVMEHNQFGGIRVKELPSDERVPTYTRSSATVPDAGQMGQFEKSLEYQQDSKLWDDIYGLAKVGYRNLDHDISRQPVFR